MSPISEARKKANKKWNDKNISERYDRISVLVPNGKKDKIKVFAEEHGEDSVNAFINRLIDEALGCEYEANFVIPETGERV